MFVLLVHRSLFRHAQGDPVEEGVGTIPSTIPRTKFKVEDRIQLPPLLPRSRDCLETTLGEQREFSKHTSELYFLC